MTTNNETPMNTAAGAPTNERQADKEHEALERQGREHAMARRITLGMELDCRQRLKQLSSELAAAVNDSRASALKTREWLEHELRGMRDEEIRELTGQFAAYGERIGREMRKMLETILELTAKK